MNEDRDLNDLQKRVAQADLSLRSLQEQQDDLGSRIRSELEQALQGFQRKNSELEQLNERIVHYQSETAQLKEMLQKLLTSIDTVGAGSLRNLTEEVESKLRTVAAAAYTHTEKVTEYERPICASSSGSQATPSPVDQEDSEELVLSEQVGDPGRQEAPAEAVPLEEPSDRSGQDPSRGQRRRIFRTGPV